MGKIKGTKLRQSRSDAAFNFTRSCRCLLHDNSRQSTLCYTKGKDLRKKELAWLIENSFVTPSAKWVCRECLKFAQTKLETQINEKGDSSISTDPSNLSHNTDANKKTVSTSDSADVVNVESDPVDNQFENMLTFLKNNELNDEQEKKLYSLLGQKLCKTVYDDSKTCSSYKNLETVLEADMLAFLKERPVGLVAFLCSISGVDILSCNYKKLYPLGLLVENLYHVRNNNFIGNFSFAQSLIQWCVHGSKLLATLNGSTSAGGSVVTLKNVLKSSSCKENKCPPGDVDVYFDNTQRVGRTTRVREHGVTPVNVATNVVFCQSSDISDLQNINNQSLRPDSWYEKHETCYEKIIEKEAELSANVFDPYRERVLDNLLQEVSGELRYDEIKNDYVDHISFSTVLDRYPNHRICTKCAKMCPKDDSRCTYCNYKCSYTIREECYGDVPAGNVERANVTIGEIVPVNPNSRNSVLHIMRELSKQCEIGTKRSWVRFGCDGLPYNIANKIKLSVYWCELCEKDVDTNLISLQDHSNTVHPESDNVNYKLSFDHVLLVPGAGHMEINLLRALFSLCRPVFLEVLVGLLGFCSKKAKEFIIGGGDHHLTWQIFQVMYHSLAFEICRVFCIQCLQEGRCVCLAHFRTWRSEMKNPVLIFLFELVFTYMLGLKCFRSGVRNNNSLFMLAGRQACTPIMFIKKHPIYQNIICNDMAVRVTAPTTVSEYIEKHEAFSVSGEDFRCEGGDYVTENENRSLKNHLPPGVPTFDNWVLASRCHGTLKSLRRKVFNMAGVNENDSEKCPVNLANEIQMFRREIRASNWLVSEEAIRSIDGKLLHQDLLELFSKAKSNYEMYLQFGNSSCPVPIFVTPADEAQFNDASNWSLKKLFRETELLLEKLDDPIADTYRSQFTLVCKQNKPAQVAFYNEVKGILEMLQDESLIDSVGRILEIIPQNTD